jgi:hypothetical protein
MLFAFSGHTSDPEDFILNRGFRIKPKMKIKNIPSTVYVNWRYQLSVVYHEDDGEKRAFTALD